MTKIISIGFRCTTDTILSRYNKRFFSGPFSYLFVDFETVMDLIANNFNNYFKNIEKYYNNNNKIKYLSHWRMSKEFYINKFYTDEITNKNIYELERFLI